MLLEHCRPYPLILYQSCKSCKLIQRSTVIAFLFGFKLRSSKFIVCPSAMAVKRFSESLTYPAASVNASFSQETILIIFIFPPEMQSFVTLNVLGYKGFKNYVSKDQNESRSNIETYFNGSLDPTKKLRKKHFKSSQFKIRQDFCLLKLHIQGFVLFEKTSNPRGVFYVMFNSVVISLKCL